MNNHELQISSMNKLQQYDGPILRHFAKKHHLSDSNVLVLGVLLDLTNQMTTEIKTTYKAIADAAGLSTMEIYRCIEFFHRNRIINYLPELNYVRIGFQELTERIEEIDLAKANARKIKILEDELKRFEKNLYVKQDDLFDLIYPLVGKIITKKIREAFSSLVNYINDRLDSSFSVKMLKCRYLAWKTSMPLPEIILRESLPFFIEQIFLIEKKSGIVIAHCAHAEAQTVDSDLVGGMLAAIGEYVKTSFNASDDESLGELSFGRYRIIVRNSVRFYAAVVTLGAPFMDFETRFESLMSATHRKYHRQLKNFDGDMSKYPDIIAPYAYLLNETNKPLTAEKERSLFKVKLLGAAIAASIIVCIGISIYDNIRDNRIKNSIVEKIKSIPKYSADVTIDVNGKNVSVKGYVSSAKTGDLIEKAIKETGSFNIENKALISDLSSIQKYDEALTALADTIEETRLIQIRGELEKIVIKFPINSFEIGDAQNLQIKRIVELIAKYPQIHVDIASFSDNIGSFDLNKRLAENRMSAISKRLAGRGISPARIHIIDFNPKMTESDSRLANYGGERGIILLARLVKKL